MKPKLNSVIALITMLFATKAMASLPPQEEIDLSAYQPTPAEFAQDIAELQIRGVIEIQDGKFILKSESALDQLRKEGRVDLVAAVNHSICY